MRPATVPLATWRALATAALAALVPASDEAWNQTVVRERFDTIPTIYGDLRRDGVYTRPAMPMPDGWTELGLGYESRAVAWPAGSPLHGPHDDLDRALVEQRQEVRLRWRQNLGTPWLTSEVSIAGSHDDRTGEEHWSDLAVDLVAPIWRARYQAVAIALGSRTPLGDERDWLLSTGDVARSSWSGRGELRGSFGLWLATLHLRAGGEYVATGRDRVEDAAGAEIALDHRLVAFDGAAGLAVRTTRWLRLGVEQSCTRRTWRPRDGESGFARFSLTDAPLVGVVELTAVAGLRLQGWAGEQLAARAELRGHERLVAGGGVAWVF